MIFLSPYFYLSLVLILALYYILPLKFRWVSLLIGSAVIYWVLSGYTKKKVLYLVAVTLVCYFMARLIRQGKTVRNRILLILTIAVCVVPFVLIKERAGSNTPDWWVVPVGLSYFTLQLVSYISDVYTGKIEAERNVLKFFLYVTFFAHVVQGPIPRYAQLSHQLTEGHRFDEKRFVKGFMLVLWGFFLKLCIADKAAVIVETVFSNDTAYQGAYILLAGSLYCIQLYTDFSGYTRMAQGVSAMVGIELAENFCRPFFSTSIKELWRRWHISLSTWLRDYIYFPLGGSKKGKVRKTINLFITFAVSGFWHGVGLSYLIWGLMQGLYQIVGDVLMPVRKKLLTACRIDEKSPCIVHLRRLGTFFLFMISVLFFRGGTDLAAGARYVRSLFTVWNPWIFTGEELFSLGLGWKECVVLIFCLLVLFLVSTLQEKGVKIRERILTFPLVFRWGLYIGTILFVMVFGTYGYGFDAHAFIYGGF